MTRVQLAETLQRSRPAVTQYFRFLANHNLVEYLKLWGPLSLTEAGARRALSAVPAERMCRCHLFTILSIPWHRALNEGSVMAKALSPDAVETMDAPASGPTIDPYCTRIPPKIDDRRPEVGKPLVALPAGHLLQILRIGRAPEQLLLELQRTNTLPRTQVVLEKRSDGQLRLVLKPEDNVVVFSACATEHVYAASAIQ